MTLVAVLVSAPAIAACSPRPSDSACDLRTLAHATVSDLTALVGAITGGDQSEVVRVRASLVDDRARLSTAVAADADLSEAQRSLLVSEIRLATQAASFVSVVPVATDQASIDRLRAAVVQVRSDIDDQLPVDGSCR
jgi:hypothetical protein